MRFRRNYERGCYRWIVIAIAFTCLAAACTSRNQGTENPNLNIAIRPAPEGANGDYLMVMLRDANDQPILDAIVALEGNMNHAGMAPVIADGVRDDADGSRDGNYHVPFRFTMMGDWIITVMVTLADGTTSEQNIEMTVGADGVSMQGAMVNEQVMLSDQHLMVMNAMAGANPLAGGNGSIYLTLMNHGNQDDQLVRVVSEAAPTVELHESIDDNGIMRMIPQPEGFAIPAGASVELAPGGKHIMLVGLTAPLVAGDEVQVTLYFAHAEPITVAVPVMAVTDMHQHEE